MRERLRERLREEQRQIGERERRKYFNRTLLSWEAAEAVWDQSFLELKFAQQ